MTNYKDIKNKKITIIGLGSSGLESAKLSNYMGAKVFASDSSKKLSVNENAFHLMETEHIPVETGKHSNRIYDADLWVVSPGVAKSSSIIKLAQKRGIPIYSELEFASWFTKAPIIAITGSNGKTTTCYLTLAFCKSQYKNSVVAGNVGIPFSKYVLQEQKIKITDRIYILEVSSFQLEFIKYFNPKISIYTNISSDHLDRHGTMKEYISMKMKMVKNSSEEDVILYNSGDKTLKDIFYKSKIHATPYNASDKENLFFIEGEYLYKKDKKLMNINEIQIKGEHNYSNLISAATCSSLLNIPNSKIKKVIKNFKGIEHRQEIVLIKKNVTYVNDSKSTNIDSVIAAVKTFKEPLIILLGGQNKGSKFQQLLPHIKKSTIKYFICYGDAGELIKSALGDAVRSFRERDLSSAVLKAQTLAIPGDTVLLSPGCASFDEFKDYEERGRFFKNLIVQKNKDD